MYRKIIITITALIVLLIGVTIVNAASQTALPGDSLYSLKTGFETAQLSAASDAGTKARLNMDFAQTRLSEIQDLVEQERYDDISIASSELEDHLAQAALRVQEVGAVDLDAAAALDNELDSLVGEQAKIIGALIAAVPDTVKPVLEATMADNANDNSNTNDNLSDNTNINGNDNGNNNGNTNDNSNDNGNANVNENGNDNGNSNGNSNDNGNNNNNDNDNDDDDNGNDNDDDHDDDDHDDDDDDDDDDDHGNDNGDD